MSIAHGRCARTGVEACMVMELNWSGKRVEVACFQWLSLPNLFGGECDFDICELKGLVTKNEGDHWETSPSPLKILGSGFASGFGLGGLRMLFLPLPLKRVVQSPLKLKWRFPHSLIDLLSCTEPCSMKGSPLDPRVRPMKMRTASSKQSCAMPSRFSRTI
jgi:hypothetical protein